MKALVPKSQEENLFKASEYQGLLLAANPCNPPNRLKNSVMLVVKELGPMIMALQLNVPNIDLELDPVVANLGFRIDSDQPVYFGGNLATNRLHFIHSLDWTSFSTIMVNDVVGVTSDLSILSALAGGVGPKSFRACAGHWSWNIDTLSQQLNNLDNPDQDYKWEAIEAEPDLIFDFSGSEQWSKVLEISAQSQVENWF